MRPLPRAARVAACLAASLLAAQPARAQQGQQIADTQFDAAVANPAFARGAGPRVAIDAAHFNVHTADGRYRPFAALLESDGFRVGSLRQTLSAAALEGVDVLVIANALADSSSPAAAARPAFADDEIEAVWTWVNGGGALLLVADHEPAGAAAKAMGARFGVDMSAGRTFDLRNADPGAGSPTWLVFTRDGAARVADHPVTRGRGDSERIGRVVTFTGQSLKGPEGSVAFLQLAPTAMDAYADGRDVPAAGRAQGVAFGVGRGKVVVLGEAGMLSAQVASAGGVTRRFGFTWPATDDRQLALNVVRWLAGAIR
jgi:hypothetical protein